MAVAGIAAISWFAVTKVVGCCEPFQFTTALVPKPLPLTVKTNPAAPALALSGESSVATGTTPACGAATMGELYPPHPAHKITSNNTKSIFIKVVQNPL